jgi:hypothetical protein
MFAVPRALLLRVPVVGVPVARVPGLRRLALWLFTVALWPAAVLRPAAGLAAVFGTAVLCRLGVFGAGLGAGFFRGADVLAAGWRTAPSCGADFVPVALCGLAAFRGVA